tara:strand:+ start:1024 stop:1230 length:207 start_codon:yes stop_codon:yes gene_type:complete
MADTNPAIRLYKAALNKAKQSDMSDIPSTGLGGTSKMLDKKESKKSPADIAMEVFLILHKKREELNNG